VLKRSLVLQRSLVLKRSLVPGPTTGLLPAPFAGAFR
jgi:hypothetical protein